MNAPLLNEVRPNQTVFWLKRNSTDDVAATADCSAPADCSEAATLPDTGRRLTSLPATILGIRQRGAKQLATAPRLDRLARRRRVPLARIRGGL
jgi:hypothetical protein